MTYISLVINSNSQNLPCWNVYTETFWQLLNSNYLSENEQPNIFQEMTFFPYAFPAKRQKRAPKFEIHTYIIFKNLNFHQEYKSKFELRKLINYKYKLYLYQKFVKIIQANRLQPNAVSYIWFINVLDSF